MAYGGTQALNNDGAAASISAKARLLFVKNSEESEASATVGIPNLHDSDLVTLEPGDEWIFELGRAEAASVMNFASGGVATMLWGVLSRHK